ncbi:hypothetical protein A3D05_05900 [Candidatus Gottesmanbacteria bacterium RIFCSPHIGHO2_02_FULL_40_24]|uniref:Glycosyltransferase 2-like domain-containing protein n=1 Tax=Candidatus Gottesmanbacteria bacterium RIFCSPHIGHO2_01_FULL_40_15 TaxID=1798376 RepID=A0A1F5Z7E3_9BACT|nr:MAG: hypothetical protein A2777_02820 [Candidatus Gottesmanbacteria bacterium RIFCSPHIGHO2_01_FULL_40_15]OGG16773.1 MAG: hypothetical protein A3D05_05900 [Candidatus Gottesmanbacteria bacterium RIFCSPHIGHO2_02_FULL_40_24]OGG23094.1 MAG: hypothetical protein A3E42_03995 [Candidatus Gottesmanbacteria bacterium RIFCSPHIGHO2_12_FULL_40_13]OGG23243.1 MAG: hypothetical protein A3B48_00515 [Candidatus Gottesmanbacteria bacterium RIFCSPLOWO2_01_FULL_40_10]OGG33119.1 MAG: hypothetical protein A3I80_0
MKKIYAVVLNYNGYNDTQKCLATLHHLKDKSYSLKIVVVDNGSNPNQKKLLKNYLNHVKWGKSIRLGKIKLIINKKNFGFAGGNNIGIKCALKKGADYILLLNNDIKTEMNFLKNLLKIDAPISSPVVKFREFKNNPKMIYDLGGIVNWWTGRTTHINVYSAEYKKMKENKPVTVDYVAGCSMLIKKETIEKIGFLDECYFMYFEDVDYCVTAKKNGFTIKVDPKGVIYHKLGGSIERWSAKAIFHNLFGNFIFISKHLGIRRITGYAYLSALTAKIIADRIRSNLKI